MDILLAIEDLEPDEWIRGTCRRLPHANVRLWTPDDTAPADYLLCWKPQARALQPRQGLKAIFNLGAGIDALLRIIQAHPGTAAEQVPVMRVEDGGMASQMVQYAVYCALRYLRDFPDYEAQARQHQWQPLPTRRPEHFTVGVLGAGKLGQPVAQALHVLGFDVRSYSRSMKTLEGITSFAGEAQLPAFAQGARLLVNLLPNTPQTRNILNARLFACMAHGSFIVNLARGDHLCEEDLLAALASGQIARAALDVFREEPLPAQHPFWQHPQIELTPHISARTFVTECIEQIAGRIEHREQGGVLQGIDLQRGY